MRSNRRPGADEGAGRRCDVRRHGNQEDGLPCRPAITASADDAHVALRDMCCRSAARFGPRATSLGYAQAMSENHRVERGWIFVNGTRQDDGTIKLGTGGEMRFSPFEAISQRQDTQITWGDILRASVQRLAFWRR
jgi:hypothetical protein